MNKKLLLVYFWITLIIISKAFLLLSQKHFFQVGH